MSTEHKFEKKYDEASDKFLTNFRAAWSIPIQTIITNLFNQPNENNFYRLRLRMKGASLDEQKILFEELVKRLELPKEVSVQLTKRLELSSYEYDETLLIDKKLDEVLRKKLKKDEKQWLFLGLMAEIYPTVFFTFKADKCYENVRVLALITQKTDLSKLGAIAKKTLVNDPHYYGNGEILSNVAFGIELGSPLCLYKIAKASLDNQFFYPTLAYCKELLSRHYSYEAQMGILVFLIPEFIDTIKNNMSDESSKLLNNILDWLRDRFLFFQNSKMTANISEDTEHQANILKILLKTALGLKDPSLTYNPVIILKMLSSKEKEELLGNYSAKKNDLRKLNNKFVNWAVNHKKEFCDFIIKHNDMGLWVTGKLDHLFKTNDLKAIVSEWNLVMETQKELINAVAFGTGGLDVSGIVLSYFFHPNVFHPNMPEVSNTQPSGDVTKTAKKKA